MGDVGFEVGERIGIRGAGHRCRWEMKHSRATLHSGAPCFNSRVQVAGHEGAGTARKAARDARNVPLRLKTRHERLTEKTRAARDNIGLWV
jgi:hypothetical protein